MGSGFRFSIRLFIFPVGFFLVLFSLCGWLCLNVTIKVCWTLLSRQKGKVCWTLLSRQKGKWCSCPHCKKRKDNRKRSNQTCWDCYNEDQLRQQGKKTEEEEKNEWQESVRRKEDEMCEVLSSVRFSTVSLRFFLVLSFSLLCFPSCSSTSH